MPEVTKNVSVDIEQLREYSARQAKDAETIVNLCDGVSQLDRQVRALTATLAARDAELAAIKALPKNVPSENQERV